MSAMFIYNNVYILNILEPRKNIVTFSVFRGSEVQLTCDLYVLALLSIAIALEQRVLFAP